MNKLTNNNLNVPISRTNLKDIEIQSVLEPLKSGWLVQGPKVRDFENKWSKFTGSQESIAVTSCTSAMLISLAALGIKPGDEIIVPAFTWVSTANVVENLGAKVVFCDIDLESFNIDIKKLTNLINNRTKCIIPVHLFGLSAQMTEILSIAKEFNLFVIEDAACGFGSRLNGQHVGTFGNTGCFSFHPRKAITTGEGGMITTNDKKLAEKIRQYRDHGAVISDLQRHKGPKPYILADHKVAGYNQRMTDIQGILGSMQMNRSKEILDERKAIANIYFKELKNLNELKLPDFDKNFTHGFQSFVCLFKPKKINLEDIKSVNKDRNNFMDYLNSNGIATRPGTHAVHMLEFYKRKYNIKPHNFINSYIANDCSISFPIYNGMTFEEQTHVIDHIKKFFS
tara:strand:- start:4299 stop:5489 length:1191 start_codon:yes stop_codon:yes gene_type:complete